MFKCSVAVTKPGLIAGSDLGRQGYRNAAVANVGIGQFDFVLVGLHLKAGRGSENRTRRSEQNAFISGFVQGVLRSGKENDVVIIGDYNMIPDDDDENFRVMNAGGSLRFVSSEALADSFTHTSGSPGNLLDGYAFTNADPAEYRDGSVAIVPMHEWVGLSLADYAAQVTDHLPFLAEFDLSVDHD